MKEVIIIVPVYKENLNFHECNSLKQLFTITNKKYKICLIGPESMSYEFYKNTFELTDNDILRYWDTWFSNQFTYSNLLLNYTFYENFKEYEYMFIYQTDAWIFKDELDYWCNKDYDYIGAPILRSYNYIYKSNFIYKKLWMNGGLSLRKIQSFISNSKNINIDCETHRLGEDVVIANWFEFKKIPSFNDAVKFSFDVFPDFLYMINNFETPFCCHGYIKHGYDFYKNLNLIKYY